MRNLISHALRTTGVLLALAGLALSMIPPTAGVTGTTRTARKSGPSTKTESVNQKVQKSYGQLPLKFEANRGQTDQRVKFIARGQGYTVFLTPTEATMKLRAATNDSPDQDQAKSSTVLRMKFLDTNPRPRIEGSDELAGVSNYFSGRDRRKWLHNIPSYARVNYRNLYPGIDLTYYERDGELEYDYVVAPGSDPARIKVAFEGAKKVSLDSKGNLLLTTAIGDVVHEAPIAYQETAEGRKLVKSNYILEGAGQVGFALGEYDHSLALVIDPVMKIAFSTYFGSRGDDNCFEVAVDSAGSAIIVGATESIDYPASNSTFGNIDAFVTKFDATGTSTIYSIYFGGRKNDNALSVALDSAGNAYITGQTESPDFPTTPGVVQEEITWDNIGPVPVPSVEAYLTKFDRGGEIIFCSFLGGNKFDSGIGIAVDGAGRAYVTGAASGSRFPVKNEFQDNNIGSEADAFLTVFNANATGLIYSTYFGGNEVDLANDVAIDAAGNAYIVGASSSDEDFPTKSPASGGPFQDVFAGREDVFVAKFNPFTRGEASLIYSTFIGGAGTDQGLGIAVDNLNRAHVTGLTGSFNFPLAAVPGAQILDQVNIINEAFVLSLNADGSALNFSTFLGGDRQDAGRGLRLDAAGNIYIAGNTTSLNFPVARAFQPEFGGGDLSEGFVTKLAPDGRAILYSSYLGGRESDVPLSIAIDAIGNAYVAGDTTSDDFIITPGVVQSVRAGSGDAFLTKIKEMNADTIGVLNAAGQFQLRNSNSEGPPDIAQQFASAGDLPVKGDWEGDGIDTYGFFRASANLFSLATLNDDPQNGPIFISFGVQGDLPIAGDWDGDGDDEPGTFNAGKFTVRSNTDQATFTLLDIAFGLPGDIPVAGDWDGDGDDTVGVWRPTTGEFFLTLSNENPQNDLVIVFGGLPGDQPVAGDWNGDGIDSIGIYGVPRGREPFAIGFFLSNSNSVAVSDLVFGFGQVGDIPIAGDWDGNP